MTLDLDTLTDEEISNALESLQSETTDNCPLCNLKMKTVDSLIERGANQVYLLALLEGPKCLPPLLTAAMRAYFHMGIRAAKIIFEVRELNKINEGGE